MLVWQCLVAQSSPTLQSHGLQPVRLLCLWGISRQEYWSGLPCPPPGDFPNPGIEPRSPSLQTYSLPFEPPGKHILCGKYELMVSFMPGRFLSTRNTTIRPNPCPPTLLTLSYIYSISLLNWDYNTFPKSSPL